MKESVIYARVSSKDQEREGYSIPAQRKTLTEYAPKNGFQIVREFVDVETAKCAGREQFGEMIAFLRKNPQLPHGNCRKDRPALSQFPRLPNFGRFGR